MLSQLNQAPAQGPQQQQQQQQRNGEPQPLTNNQIQEQLNQFLVANGALVRVNDAGWRDQANPGVRRAGIAQDTNFDLAKAPATVVMRNEDYGRIWRPL